MDAERWEATLDRILELTVLLGQDMAEHLAREGLTESRAHLLWQLQQRGPCTQATLAAGLHVTPRTITALVDALVATGFVTREPHPSDRRAALVTFTERDALPPRRSLTVTSGSPASCSPTYRTMSSAASTPACAT